MPCIQHNLNEKLVINGKGDEIVVLPAEGTRFTNKKIPLIDEERMLHHLADAQEIYEQQEVGQREATVELHPAHPDLPVYVWLNTDDHLGSIHTDYKAFLRDYTRCRELPNFYVINNGGEAVKVHQIALGPYKCQDEYSKKNGWSKQVSTELFGSSVILEPDSKHIRYYDDILRANKEL